MQHPLGSREEDAQEAKDQEGTTMRISIENDGDSVFIHCDEMVTCQGIVSLLERAAREFAIESNENGFPVRSLHTVAQALHDELEHSMKVGRVDAYSGPSALLAYQAHELMVRDA